jgi:hypothetical protein
LVLAIGVSSALGLLGASSAGASKGPPSPKGLGTTFAFPDAGGTIVDISLEKVVENAPPQTHYKGLHGKGPVVALEFTLKNVGSKPASLALFSSVLYYKSSVAALTTGLGATKLGPSLSLTKPLRPGSHREGWLTTQGSKSTLVKIQSTLNGNSTGSWKP